MKNKMSGHLIKTVEKGSIADELGIEKGDMLLSIGGESIEDVFDYRYMINEEYLELLIRKPSGEEWELEIEKEYEDDLGIDFENSLLDEYRSCRNKCIFCFIDQLPKGMRDTLYFKDDDSRLSFLQGNYITLTNMSDHDIDRIIRYRLEPINISFHTTNPQLRCQMLHNRFAGDVFPKIDRLVEAGIEINGQVVLCKGVNDGEELGRTMRDFERYLPSLRSVSIVPVGLTKFRDGLFALDPFNAQDARTVIAQIEKMQSYYFEKYGTYLVHPGDEWYFLAGMDMPPAEKYEGYPQLENGVGMVTLLRDEVKERLGELTGDDRKRHVSVATGKLIGEELRKAAAAIREKFSNVAVDIYEIRNDFFGEGITVAGLLTGQDICSQLKGKELGECLIISRCMLRSGEEVFLDDMSVQELETSLQIPICIVESDGQSLVNACIDL